MLKEISNYKHRNALFGDSCRQSYQKQKEEYPQTHHHSHTLDLQCAKKVNGQYIKPLNNNYDPCIRIYLEQIWFKLSHSKIPFCVEIA